MSISFVGVLSIISRGEWSVLTSLSFNQGDMIVFLAMVSWAIYTLVIQRMPKEINRIGLMSVQMFLGLLVVLPFYLWKCTRRVAELEQSHAARAGLRRDCALGAGVSALHCGRGTFGAG